MERKEEAMACTETVIDTSEQGWQKRVAGLMKRRAVFGIVTADPDFSPGADDFVNMRKWVQGDGAAIAAAGALTRAATSMTSIFTALLPHPRVRHKPPPQPKPRAVPFHQSCIR
jgi:hypothetical protein